jgi:uncharacterized phosphosugar-binding protein
MHAYEVRPRKDKRGVDQSAAHYRSAGCGMRTRAAIDYAKHRSRSHRAVIRVYDAADNVIETHEHKGDFKEP